MALLMTTNADYIGIESGRSLADMMRVNTTLTSIDCRYAMGVSNLFDNALSENKSLLEFRPGMTRGMCVDLISDACAPHSDGRVDPNRRKKYGTEFSDARC